MSRVNALLQCTVCLFFKNEDARLFGGQYISMYTILGLLIMSSTFWIMTVVWGNCGLYKSRALFYIEGIFFSGWTNYFTCQSKHCVHVHCLPLYFAGVVPANFISLLCLWNLGRIRQLHLGSRGCSNFPLKLHKDTLSYHPTKVKLLDRL